LVCPPDELLAADADGLLLRQLGHGAPSFATSPYRASSAGRITGRGLRDTSLSHHPANRTGC
ncbi:MAG: hypothetical protein ACXVII_35390, partial [Solirubrobacteraceae bacterium]